MNKKILLTFAILCMFSNIVFADCVISGKISNYVKVSDVFYVRAQAELYAKKMKGEVLKEQGKNEWRVMYNQAQVIMNFPEDCK